MKCTSMLGWAHQPRRCVVLLFTFGSCWMSLAVEAYDCATPFPSFTFRSTHDCTLDTHHLLRLWQTASWSIGTTSLQMTRHSSAGLFGSDRPRTWAHAHLAARMVTAEMLLRKWRSFLDLYEYVCMAASFRATRTGSGFVRSR